MDTTKKINITELIRIARENKDKLYNKNISENLNEATKFTLAFGITQGKNKIYADIVYKTYEKWSLNAINKLQFFKQFCELFESKQEGSKRFFCLNYKPAELLNEVERMKVDYEE